MKRIKDAGSRQIQRDLASQKYHQRVVKLKTAYNRKPKHRPPDGGVFFGLIFVFRECKVSQMF